MRGRYNDGKTTEFFCGLQSEGGVGRDARRRDDGGVGGAVQNPPEHDHEVEARCAGWGQGDVPAGKGPVRPEPREEIKDLQAKIGELVVERDFLAKTFNR